jgi:Flp pilus assembly pilin Flp
MSADFVLGSPKAEIRKPQSYLGAWVLKMLFPDEAGQDVAEYAVMLAVILVVALATVRLIGTNANIIFSSVASSIQ